MFKTAAISKLDRPESALKFASVTPIERGVFFMFELKVKT